MRRLLFIAAGLFCLLPSIVLAVPPGSVLEKIETARSRGEISRDEAVLYKAFSIFSRERLPQRFSPDEVVPKPIKESTTLIRQLKRDFETISPAMQDVIRPYLFREKKGVGPRAAFKMAADRTGRSPKTVLDTHTLTNWTTTANFNIEWGDDVYVDPADVARWAEYFETSWTSVITNMGYALPKKADSYLVDVYIGNTDSNNQYSLNPGWYGYTDIYQSPYGVPYFVVNNDYGWVPYNDDPEGDAAGAMKVTAAHEFFHAVHLTIDYWEDAWWMEASSTWMEDAVYDAVNDYRNYLTSWPIYPYVSLVLFNGSHEYGDVIWGKYLSENWGSSAAIKSVWDNCTTIKGPTSVQATESFFASHTTTLSDAFKSFTIKNLFMDYSEGSTYGSMALRASHSVYPHFQDSRDLPSSTGKDPDYLGANYIRFDPFSGTDLTLSFDGDEYVKGRAVQWGATVALKTLSGYSTVDIPLDAAQSGSVIIENYTGYESIHLVPAVLSPTGLTPLESSYTPYGEYPDGVPYAYDACIDCTPPAFPLLEFPENDSLLNSGGAGGGGGGGGCFIATAAFGYYDEPHVMLLRRFRDEYLLTNGPGRFLVDLYYSSSPPMASFIAEHGWLKGAVRAMLLPLIGFAWVALEQMWLLFLFAFIFLSLVILKLTSAGKTLSEQ